MAEAGAIVRLAGLVKRYGATEVVRGVDLEVQPGERVALIGHNGAGKTTLMKLMLGLTRPSAGTVRVCGEDPAGAHLHQAVGYLPESVSFHDAMSGRELLAFYARLKGLPASACDPLLEQVGLAPAARRPVRTYSKGMRQRLGLAQAILGAPRLLFLDEPTTGLDPQVRGELFALIQRLHERGTTVLLSSHTLTEIESRVDRFAILRQGELVACGSLDDLRRAAGLPVRIRVSVSKGAAARVAADLVAVAEPVRVNDCTVDLSCVGTRKMEVVRRLAELDGPVRDLEIMPPRLDDIYAHFAAAGRPR